MLVRLFRLPSDQPVRSLSDESSDPVNWMRTVCPAYTARLIVSFVQTWRASMFDRSFSDEINAPIAAL